MRNRLSDADYAAVLSCIEAIYRCASLDEFPMHTIAELRKLVDSHLAGYNEVNLARGRIVAVVDPPQPEFLPLVKEFEKLMHEHPVISYFDRTGDGQALKISDFLGAREYRRRAIYREVYRHMGVEDQMAIGVRLERGFMIGLALARRDRSFTEKDRMRLNLVRPHLVHAYQRVAELAGAWDQQQDYSAALREHGVGVISLDAEGELLHATPGALDCLCEFWPTKEKAGRLPEELECWAVRTKAEDTFSKTSGTAKLIVRRAQSADRTLLLVSKEGDNDGKLERYQLTPRELEVLQRIAQGKTNTEIALGLSITLGTVKLHVGRILQKLGVENRTAAAVMMRDGVAKTKTALSGPR